MRFTLLAICFGVLVVVASYPVVAFGSESSSEEIESTCDGYKDVLSDMIKKFLEKVRAHMGTGIPALHIPPLDPLHIPHDDVRLKKRFQYDLTGSIDNSSMEGLHAFNVTSIKTNIFHMQANLTVLIPYLFVTGEYELKGSALSVIPIRGKGLYILKPSGIEASVYMGMSISHGHVQMSSMDFNVALKDLYAIFDGLFGGGMFGNLVNSLMNRFGLSLFRRIEPRIHERVRVALLTEINALLKDIPLGELVELITENSKCASELERFIKRNTQ